MMKLKTIVVLVLSGLLCQGALTAAPDELLLQSTESVLPRDPQLGILSTPSGGSSREVRVLLRDLFLGESPQQHFHGTTKDMLLVLFEEELSLLLPAERLRFGRIEERVSSTRVPLRLFYRREGRLESSVGSVFLQPENDELKVVHMSFDFSLPTN
ncbi:MAG: hypothetical protein ACQEQU_09375 [Spirochaetota bacterium]